jgi:hypothetical protein
VLSARLLTRAVANLDRQPGYARLGVFSGPGRGGCVGSPLPRGTDEAPRHLSTNPSSAKADWSRTRGRSRSRCAPAWNGAASALGSSRDPDDSVLEESRHSVVRASRRCSACRKHDRRRNDHDADRHGPQRSRHNSFPPYLTHGWPPLVTVPRRLTSVPRPRAHVDACSLPLPPHGLLVHGLGDPGRAFV